MEDPVRPSASGAANEEEEEIASVKRVPAVTLHLWENILKHRGFEVQGGRLVRSPSKSQSASQHQPRDVSPSRAPAKPSRRGTLKDLDDDSDGDRPRSAISAFRRARSFMPPVKDTSTPLAGVRQPFQRSSTMSRASSFLQRSVGSIHAQGGISTDIPIASTSALAGPSRAGSLAPEDDFAKATSAVSEAARTIFKGLHFRALGEARCASVKRAIEDCGGTWAGPDDDADADIVIVRLVSGSTLYQQEPDAHERAKFRTECWLERCLFAERVCDPAEHVAFTPLTAQPPVDGADSVQLSFSGLDHAEACWIKRLLRALGECIALSFPRLFWHRALRLRLHRPRVGSCARSARRRGSAMEQWPRTDPPSQVSPLRRTSRAAQRICCVPPGSARKRTKRGNGARPSSPWTGWRLLRARAPSHPAHPQSTHPPRSRKMGSTSRPSSRNRARTTNGWRRNLHLPHHQGPTRRARARRRLRR